MPFLAMGFDKHGDKHGKGNGQGKGHGKKHGNKHGARYFRDEDIIYIREHYDGSRDLPPGLRKKYYRRGTLPPGWEKRMRPMPVVIVQRLPPPPPYCAHGYIDGYAVVYDTRTRVILDVIDIFNAATGR
ncbi:MAG: hypothetical protein ACM336_13110 [Acidobacteriota bacterium]